MRGKGRRRKFQKATDFFIGDLFEWLNRFFFPWPSDMT